MLFTNPFIYRNIHVMRDLVISQPGNNSHINSFSEQITLKAKSNKYYKQVSASNNCFVFLADFKKEEVGTFDTNNCFVFFNFHLARYAL